ncbi:hypothetical protein [Actinoplanes sp. NPDC049118]|uniref:hypothetical protein n=1 Tax=Actinoplanes sp. NPDC049118 TaxID=3155769 RepID=UPI0033FDA7E8
MSDVERLLRDAMHERAEQTLAGTGLLADVHRRSARRDRRRRFKAAGVGLATLLVAVGVVTGVVRPGGDDGSRRAVPATASLDPGGLRLLAPSADGTPVFPYRPGVTPAGGFAAPVVSIEAGRIVAFYEAKDPVRGVDVTISVGGERPVFDAPAGPVSEKAQRLHGGRPATLRTVSVSPAAQLSLYWQESPARWVRIDTDDTFTAAELVNFANRLEPASVPVTAPFRLDVAPVGMLLDTVTASMMSWRPATGAATNADLVSCVLTRPRTHAGPTTTVGRYRGTLRRTATETTLTVALDDRDQSLVVRVPARYPISDADLVRFAAGVDVTDHAEPAGG